MDFIERFFHLSPDGGNGTTEIIWLAVAIFAVASILFRKRIISTVRLR